MSFVKALLLRKSSAWLIPGGFFIIVAVTLLAVIVRMNGGHFTYALDDPFIHLALADHIANGHYGVNSNEYSAPASSIIWPFLLAAFKIFTIDTWLPLILNVVFSILGIVLFSMLWDTIFKNTDDMRRRPLQVIFGIVFVLTIGFIPLSFTGMEHVLQITTSMAIVCGLIIEREEGRVPWWLVPAIVLSPLVRFENAALSLLAGIALWHYGYRRKTLTAAFLVLATLAGFSLFLHSLGLGFVPTSVLIKSRTAWNPNKLDAVLKNLLANVNSRQGAGLLFSSLFLLRPLFKKTKEGPVALVVLGAVAAQILLGDLGQLRYTAYLFAIVSIALLYIYREAFYGFTRSASLRWMLPVSFAAILAFNGLALTDMPLIPIAANNVYEQQYQMSRFAREFYKKPVAVNDLGYVSFKNNSYVLDLWGLASKPAFEIRLKERMGQPAGDWMNDFTRKYNVKMAMIYDAWFPAIPKGWKKVAILHLSRLQVSSAQNSVDFYSLDQSGEAELIKQLQEFKTTLPPGVKLDIFE